MVPWQHHPASFRDPAGQVFSEDGFIYRSIFRPGRRDYEEAHDKGIYQKLIQAGLLYPHLAVDPPPLAPSETVYCLRHFPLPMISYPWEWSFSMLQDAAVLHLDALEMLLAEGFWLRDASALNAQYDGKRMCLIDTLSVGRRPPKSPWVAYGQFCSHFLVPLALAAYCDIRLLALWREYVNGYPLDLGTKMLPWVKKYHPRLFWHLTLHALFQRRAEHPQNLNQGASYKMPRVSDRSLLGLVRSLRRTISYLKWRGTATLWKDYKIFRPYRGEDAADKLEYVDKVIQRVKPSKVWDLGSNTGEFSMLAATHGSFVVSMDADPACTEALYQQIKSEQRNNILPLTMNLTNPSPGLGWDHQERSSLRERGPADLVLALALIHHLVFSSNIPLPLIADWFRKITTYLLIEFIPATDPMVQRFLVARSGNHLPYSLDSFQSSFGEYFDILDCRNLPNGRILFLMQGKGYATV